eukprot:2043210-Pyramimonas_sp.AAC.1
MCCQTCSPDVRSVNQSVRQSVSQSVTGGHGISPGSAGKTNRKRKTTWETEQRKDERQIRRQEAAR